MRSRRASRSILPSLAMLACALLFAYGLFEGNRFMEWIAPVTLLAAAVTSTP
jgi:hypothetical protein